MPREREAVEPDPQRGRTSRRATLQTGTSSRLGLVVLPDENFEGQVHPREWHSFHDLSARRRASEDHELRVAKGLTASFAAPLWSITAKTVALPARMNSLSRATVSATAVRSDDA